MVVAVLVGLEMCSGSVGGAVVVDEEIVLAHFEAFEPDGQES